MSTILQQPGIRGVRAAAASRYAATIVLSGLAACQPAPAPRSTVAPTPVEVEPIPAFEASVTQLDATEAANAARATAEEVNARLADGLRLSLWASEQLIADPIAISLDSLGRAFVTRTRRTDNAEIDIRGHQDWMVESITFDNVEDKRAFYHRELAPERSAQNEWLTDYNQDGSRDWRDLTVH